MNINALLSYIYYFCKNSPTSAILVKHNMLEDRKAAIATYINKLKGSGSVKRCRSAALPNIIVYKAQRRLQVSRNLNPAKINNRHSKASCICVLYSVFNELYVVIYSGGIGRR